MAHLVDAESLVDLFAETDPRMPILVFALLSLYLADGPFEFDAAKLSERLAEIPMKARVNPEELASLQPDLERFFAPSPEGWAPRRGVLHYERGADAGSAHAGALPGQLT
jgi:hypothetical protein